MHVPNPSGNIENMSKLIIFKFLFQTLHNFLKILFLVRYSQPIIGTGASASALAPAGVRTASFARVDRADRAANDV